MESGFQMENAVRFDNLSGQSNSKPVQAADSLVLSGIALANFKSPVTNGDYIEWLGKPNKK
jgi:hypothetical protein